MSKTFIPVLIVIIIIVGALWYGWSKDSAEQEEQPIKIGTIYQETGSGADWGEKAEKGIKIATEKINSQGGIHGSEIEIIYEDSKSNASDAVSAMNKLVSIDDVKVILSQQSSVVVSLSPVANNNQVILMDTGATTPAYISPDDFTFRVSYSAPHFARKISSHLDKKGIESMAILYVNNDFGTGMFNTYQEVFKGEIIAQESFLETDVDFKTQIQKIKEADPEVVVYVAQVKQAGILLKQIAELGLEKPLYTDIYSIEYPAVLEVAKEAAEGVIYASQYYDTKRTDSVFKEFNDSFREGYKEISDPLSAQAYDGLMVLADVMNKCDNPEDTECLKTELFNLQAFSGVVGPITFDENGEVIERPTLLKTVKDGQFEYLTKIKDI